MKHHSNELSIDMDQIARVFTWLTATLVIFALGMVFEVAIQHDLDVAASTTDSAATSTQTTPSSNE